MERLIFVPLERMSNRYTDQWYNWFDEQIYIPHTTIEEKGKAAKVGSGSYVDTIRTTKHKISQLNWLTSAIAEGWSGTIFFMDLWFPGIETIAYLRDNLKRAIRIEGIFHGGSWDKWDFISQNNCTPWARHAEMSWIKMVDRIYVGSNFHKKMISDTMNLKHKEKSKIIKVRFPCWLPDDSERKKYERENYVLFPHRLTPEKGVKFFNRLEKDLKRLKISAKCIKTLEVCKTKQEFYNLLLKSKVVVSFAEQETFGISMLEGLNAGCIPVAPNRLSYPETLGGKIDNFPLFNNYEECLWLVIDALENYKLPRASRYTPNCLDIVKRIEA
jgi:glycosyltransferase involved in cell wall biosynthesis